MFDQSEKKRERLGLPILPFFLLAVGASHFYRRFTRLLFFHAWTPTVAAAADGE